MESSTIQCNLCYSRLPIGPGTDKGKVLESGISLDTTVSGMLITGDKASGNMHLCSQCVASLKTSLSYPEIKTDSKPVPSHAEMFRNEIVATIATTSTTCCCRICGKVGGAQNGFNGIGAEIERGIKRGVEDFQICFSCSNGLKGALNATDR